MLTSIIGIVLSVSLLAANTRAEQYAGSPRGDEPAHKSSSSEPVQQQSAQSNDSQNAPAGKPAQAQTKEERRIQEIRNRLRQYGPAARITVVLWNDNERYGSLELIDADSFQLKEVDLNQEVRIAYKDVKKVRRGYGEFNGITGKRVNPKTDLIVKIAAVAIVIFVLPFLIPRT